VYGGKSTLDSALEKGGFQAAMMRGKQFSLALKDPHQFIGDCRITLENQDKFFDTRVLLDVTKSCTLSSVEALCEVLETARPSVDKEKQLQLLLVHSLQVISFQSI